VPTSPSEKAAGEGAGDLREQAALLTAEERNLGSDAKPRNTAVFQDELRNRQAPFAESSALSLSPTAGEAALLTTESLVLSNDDDGAPERMVVALTTVRMEVCGPWLDRETLDPLPVSA
jgi:hypothetical protein